MQKRNPIQSDALDYSKIDDMDFCKLKISSLIRALAKGMPLPSACDLAQVKTEQVRLWMEEYDEFGILVRSAKATFLEKLFDSLNEKASSNANTAIRFFSEIRKMEKENLENDQENDMADDLFEIANAMDDTDEK